MKICMGCARAVAPELLSHARCPTCRAAQLASPAQKAQDAKRNVRRKRDGREGAAWRALRIEVIQRDGFQCQRCGLVGAASSLTVHKLGGGSHVGCDPDELVTLCRSCHGTVDAPKASRARRV